MYAHGNVATHRNGNIDFIHIDTGNISFTNFDLSPEDKAFLVRSALERVSRRLHECGHTRERLEPAWLTDDSLVHLAVSKGELQSMDHFYAPGDNAAALPGLPACYGFPFSHRNVDMGLAARALCRMARARRSESSVVHAHTGIRARGALFSRTPTLLVVWWHKSRRRLVRRGATLRLLRRGGEGEGPLEGMCVVLGVRIIGESSLGLVLARETAAGARDHPRGPRATSLGERDADARVLDVERRVLAHEDVAEDPERAGRRGDVDALHREDALAARLDDVLLEREAVLDAAEREREVGRVGLVAVDEVLARDVGLDAERVGERGDVGRVLPASRLVPESTMALVVLPTAAPPTVRPSSSSCQYASRLTGTYAKSPS